MDDRVQDQATPPTPGGVCFRVAGQARPNYLCLLLALIIIGGGVAYLLNRSTAPNATPADGTQTNAQGVPSGGVDTGSRAAISASNSTPSAVAARAAQDSNDLARYVTPGQPAPTMGEVIARLHDAGVHEGLGAFNPPGTSPPLVGLAVPEDFPLPPGYVRHHQTTDDGQRIEAMLMFSPDYEFFDSNGQPLAIPDNRVVPPELAPPGLPIRTIVIPPPLDPRSPPP